MILPLSYVSAAGLTTEQINSIIGLLRVFGADQTTINNVQISLSGGTPSTNPTNQPSIKVLSPNGGETFNIGDKVTIKWSAPVSLQTVWISLESISTHYAGGGVGGYIPDIRKIFTQDANNSGSYAVNIPSVPSGKYKILIEGIDNSGKPVVLSDSSDNYFTITSQTSAQPKITVLSPNGGQSFEIETDSLSRRIVSIPISWRTNYDPKNFFTISFVDSDGNEFGTRTAWGSDYPISGQNMSYSLTEKTSSIVGLPSNQFKVKICSSPNKVLVCDYSDSYFTISSSGSSTNNSPKIVGFPAIPANIQSGQLVNVSLSAQDADNDDLSWNVDWGENIVEAGSCSVVRRQTGTGWTLNRSHSWANAGVYKARVTVFDCVGGATDSYSFTVNVGTVAIPTITVLTPTNSSGVSSFKSGENVRFQWSIQNMLGIRKITLIPADSMGVQTTVVDTGETGSPITRNYYDWTVPTTVKNGKYYIEIQRGSGATAVTGKSNGYITINSVTQTTTSSVLLVKTISVSPTATKWGDKITVTSLGNLFTATENEATIHSTSGGVISLGFVNSGDKRTATFELPSTKYATGEYKLYVTNGNLVDLGPVNISISAPLTQTESAPITLSASLLSTSEDKAGSWSVFAPGTYSSLSPGDWNIGATLNLPTAKNIKSISLNLSDNTGIWVTNNGSYWPLVVMEGDKQLAFSYVSTLGYFGSGNHSWKIYAQKNGTVWPGGKLVVTFDDNTTVSAEIPASANISM